MESIDGDRSNLHLLAYNRFYVKHIFASKEKFWPLHFIFKRILVPIRSIEVSVTRLGYFGKVFGNLLFTKVAQIYWLTSYANVKNETFLDRFAVVTFGSIFEEHFVTFLLFLEKVGHPRPVFVYFRLFKQTLQISQQNKCPSSILCWVSNPWPLEHESPTITTNPGSRATLFILPSGRTDHSSEIKQTLVTIFRIKFQQIWWIDCNLNCLQNCFKILTLERVRIGRLGWRT